MTVGPVPLRASVPMCAQSLSHVQLFVTPWTVASQVPLSMGFSRQKILESVAMPSSSDLLNAGMEPTSLAPSELAGGFFTTSATWHVGYSSLIRDGTWATCTGSVKS